jgi:hypothetical protein
MPISARPKWYSRKTPTLQIEILNAIATEGQLSKTMAKELTGSHYPDVSDAIDELAKRQFIESNLTFFLHPKSRHRRFFQLTHNGLMAFIDEKPSPTEFWMAVHWFCKLSKRKIDWNTFNSLYNRFQDIYLGYTPHHGHFFQFTFIDMLIKKWLKDNDKIYDPVIDNMVKPVPFSQCVLECLGMNRLVTLDQLYRYIEEQIPIFEPIHAANRYWQQWLVVPKEKIKRLLEDLTLSANYREPYHSPRPDVRYELDQRLNSYVDFIQHLIVVPRYNKKGETRYELSLFGLVLVMAIRAYEYLNPERVFYNNLEFGEYCTKLAANYQDKLPLVFGKWDSLMRETLGDNRILFEILRDLFYDHTSKAMIESSVISGGVKEYYEGVKALSNWAYPRLEKIRESGEKVLQQLGQPNDCYCNKMLSAKIDEIRNSIRQRNLDKFMEGLRVGGEPDSPIKDPRSIYANELVYTEKAFADEISFLFYTFFYVRDFIHRDRFEPIYSTYFPSLFKPVYLTRMVHLESGVRMFEDRQEIYTGDMYPPQSFVNIIRNHEDVRQLLVSWIDDATKCQSDVQSKISGLRDYTRKGDQPQGS